jgi:adenosylcobyric acid synthase
MTPMFPGGISRRVGGGIAPCLMIQGTSSGVGKSVVATALCRLFARAGLHVAPFKAQNMALNASVADGGEIGRSQAAQAEAAGIEPSVDMNPVLLKPETDRVAQVIVRGRVWGRTDFHGYAGMREEIWPVVVESLRRLRQHHDLIIIEGAGSPAEINLRDRDIANMAIAHLAEAPVLLVGDIDRGGLFAAVVGTLELLSPLERGRVAGLVVNRFRGDLDLLAPGLAMLTERTGVRVLGVIPHLDGRLVPAEDSLDLDGLESAGDPALLDVAVVRLPRIANFDDFEPLAAEPGVRLHLARRPGDLEGADLIILPGSKSTMADLDWLGERGLDRAIAAAAARGGQILGICGGYQMLGRMLRDPDHVESATDARPGLGLLPVETWFTRSKAVRRVQATGATTSPLFAGVTGTFQAYEIHAGRTAAARTSTRPRPLPPVFRVVARQGRAANDADGAVGPSGNVEGTYLHGIFADPAVRRSLLARLAERRGVAPDPGWGAPSETDRYDRLAGLVGGALDLGAITNLVGLSHLR